MIISGLSKIRVWPQALRLTYHSRLWPYRSPAGQYRVLEKFGRPDCFQLLEKAGHSLNPQQFSDFEAVRVWFFRSLSDADAGSLVQNLEFFPRSHLFSVLSEDPDRIKFTRVLDPLTGRRPFIDSLMPESRGQLFLTLGRNKALNLLLEIPDEIPGCRTWYLRLGRLAAAESNYQAYQKAMASPEGAVEFIKQLSTEACLDLFNRVPSNENAVFLNLLVEADEFWGFLQLVPDSEVRLVWSSFSPAGKVNLFRKTISIPTQQFPKDFFDRQDLKEYAKLYASLEPPEQRRFLNSFHQEDLVFLFQELKTAELKTDLFLNLEKTSLDCFIYMCKRTLHRALGDLYLELLPQGQQKMRGTLSEKYLVELYRSLHIIRRHQEKIEFFMGLTVKQRRKLFANLTPRETDNLIELLRQLKGIKDIAVLMNEPEQ